MLITERAKRKINTLLDSTNDCINYPKTNKERYCFYNKCFLSDCKRY